MFFLFLNREDDDDENDDGFCCLNLNVDVLFIRPNLFCFLACDLDDDEDENENENEGVVLCSFIDKFDVVEDDEDENNLFALLFNCFVII